MMSLVDVLLGVSKGVASAGTGIITGKILSDKTDLDTNQIVMISSGATVATYAALTGVQEIVMDRIENKLIDEFLEDDEDLKAPVEDPDFKDLDDLDDTPATEEQKEEAKQEEVPEATEEPAKEEAPVEEKAEEPNAFEVFDQPEKKPAPKKRPARQSKK